MNNLFKKYAPLLPLSFHKANKFNFENSLHKYFAVGSVTKYIYTQLNYETDNWNKLTLIYIMELF